MGYDRFAAMRDHIGNDCRRCKLSTVVRQFIVADVTLSGGGVINVTMTTQGVASSRVTIDVCDPRCDMGSDMNVATNILRSTGLMKDMRGMEVPRYGR